MVLDRAGRRAPRSLSDPPHQGENEQDHEHQPKSACRIVAPAARIAPGRQGADQGEDQDDDQDGSEGHGAVPSVKAERPRREGNAGDG